MACDCVLLCCDLFTFMSDFRLGVYVVHNVAFTNYQPYVFFLSNTTTLTTSTTEISKKEMTMMIMASLCGMNLFVGGNEELEPSMVDLENIVSHCRFIAVSLPLLPFLLPLHSTVVVLVHIIILINVN